MEKNLANCAAYFKERPAYSRMMAQMLRKYRSYGESKGYVCIEDATEDELEAARAFFGRSFSAPLKFKLSDFESELQNTPFRGVTLQALLARYAGKPLRTNQEEHKQQMQSFAEMIGQTTTVIRSDICRRWLADLAERRGGGYKLVRQEMAKGDASMALRSACKSVDWLETHAGPIRLAVLSAQATSNPHALDGNTAAGKLLLHFLAYRANCDFPKNAEQRDELYYRGGILCDSIASSVTQVGLVLNNNDNEEHPAFHAFRSRREICTLTLTNLAKLFSASSPSGKAYLVENQMVFSQLCDHAELFHSPLICTSGQPQVAVLRLLDLLSDAKTDLFYSGDFDGEGLSIAARLMARYGGGLYLWHMAPKDYAACRSEEKLGDFCWQSTDFNPDLEQTAKMLQTQGYAGYQELLLPVLLHDLT